MRRESGEPGDQLLAAIDPGAEVPLPIDHRAEDLLGDVVLGNPGAVAQQVMDELSESLIRVRVPDAAKLVDDAIDAGRVSHGTPILRRSAQIRQPIDPRILRSAICDLYVWISLGSPRVIPSSR